MKKRNWLPFKQILFTYLAINKIIYWVGLLGSDIDGLGRIVVDRLLNQDIVLIIIIVGLYFFEKKFVQMHDKLNRIYVDIVVAVVGYVMLSVTIILYSWVINLIFSAPFNLRTFLTSALVQNWTIIYIIVAVAMTIKEHIKRKTAPDDAFEALNIQCTNAKLEVLKTLLDTGVLSREEYDKQEAKLRNA